MNESHSPRNGIDWQERCRRLQDDVEELRERLRQLEEARVNPPPVAPPEWDLTPAHQRMLRELMNHRIVTLPALESAVNPDPVNHPYDSIRPYDTMRVQISLMRNKLRPHGIAVRNDYGIGYYLSADDKNRIREALT